MTINWSIVIPLGSLIVGMIGLIIKTLNYRQENLKLKIELDKYNDEKKPSLKKELTDLEDYIRYFLKQFLVYARIDRSDQIAVVELTPQILNFSIKDYNHIYNILSKEEIDFIRTTHTSMTFISAHTKGLISTIEKKEYNKFIDAIMDKYLLDEENKRILLSIAEKIDNGFHITKSSNSLTNEVNLLYDEAKEIYISIKDRQAITQDNMDN